ncbi:glycyl-radical enzyme activating protein [Bilophila wadsworthia]|uniref:glycyl-radical enzyme activating protein n=1 Tax=Bilophila wadsworthia TaxID=35833 RepID=UPI003260F724
MESGMVYNIQRMSTKDGPGLRTTVFLKGCPLHCLWCSNPESQSFHPQLLFFGNLCQSCGACERVCPYGAVVKRGSAYNWERALCQGCGACAEVCSAKARVMSGKRMSVQEVMSVMDRDSLFYANSDGGVTFGGGEPTAAGDFLVELLQHCASKGYHVCVDTCGMCSPEQFRKVLALTDLFLFDCKHMDTEEHRRLTGLGNGVILENLRQVFESGKKVRIRVPLMPHLNDSEENILAMAVFLHRYGKTEVDVLPCHAFGSSKYDALRLPRPSLSAYSAEELKRVLERFTRADLKVTIV